VVDANMRQAFDLSCKDKHFVVVGRGLEATVEIHHGEEDVAVFHVSIADAGLSEQFGSAHLEVFEKLGVVEIAHRVALGVANADGQIA